MVFDLAVICRAVWRQSGSAVDAESGPGRAHRTGWGGYRHDMGTTHSIKAVNHLDLIIEFAVLVKVDPSINLIRSSRTTNIEGDSVGHIYIFPQTRNNYTVFIVIAVGIINISWLAVRIGIGLVTE